MAKAIRKNFFNWSPEEFERVLMRLLENMKFSDIRIHSVDQMAEAVAVATDGTENADTEMRFHTSIRWIGQSNGVTVLIRVEESKYGWATGTCDRLALDLIGTIKTICEYQRGVDD